MIFDKYEAVKKTLEFTYQVSAIHSLAYMHKMFNLDLTEDNKDLLVEALYHAKPEESAAILPEVPSLVFMLHALQTEGNRDQMVEVVARLSGLYLDVIGERVDALGCSNLISGWAEIGFRDEELFKGLADIVADKDNQEAIFVKGDA
jgi:hypothetical protein